MQHYQLWNSVSNLKSKTGSLESQLLFGERILQSHTLHCAYAYSQLLHHNYNWTPYPGKIYDQCLTKVAQYYQPNAIVCSHTAVLDPLNIPIPYGSPICVNHKGSLILPKEIVYQIRPLFTHTELRINTKHVRFLSFNFCITSLCEQALQSLNFPYLWGGRCLHKSLSANMGVDCSGFVQILYQTHGWCIPRNAKDQWKDCDHVDNFDQLPQGGLVFLQPENKEINHVMLKINKTTLIHAAESAKKIILFEIGKDGDFYQNTYKMPTHFGKAFFGIPKKRKAFF